MKHSVIKVLGFDSWTKGAHHFERLLPAFAAQGMKLTLVHLGSWGNDPNCPMQETIGQLEVRDIAFYGGRSLEQILDVEQPAAVIFLSTQTFAHRAFIRYCDERSIPTLHLYHGLVNVQVTNDNRGSYKVDKRAYARFVHSKIGKLMKYTFPCYIQSLFSTGANTRDWRRFAFDVARMAIGKPAMVASEDARTTQCAVYANADIEHALRTYGFAQGSVVAVGNPDLGHFGLTQDMLGYSINRQAADTEPVMYIDTGLVAAGLIFESRDAFIRHLLETSKALAAQGKSMLFKPHPAHNIEFLQNALAGSGIELISNEDFLARLQHCAACIVETTTLALIPALMGMPLLYANYNELTQLRFGPVLVSYPRGYMLEDILSTTEIFCRDREVRDASVLDEWITLNAGPLPADEMPDRVVNIVQSMIGNANAT